MSIVYFTTRPPAYPAVRWDGTNLLAVVELVQPSRYEASLSEDDTLTITGAPQGPITVHVGQWVMPAHKAVAVDDAELRQGFTEMPT